MREIAKLLAAQLSPVFCYFFLLRKRYHPQHPVSNTCNSIKKRPQLSVYIDLKQKAEL
jgi:hypothetical protein